LGSGPRNISLRKAIHMANEMVAAAQATSVVEDAPDSAANEDAGTPTVADAAAPESAGNEDAETPAEAGSATEEAVSKDPVSDKDGSG
jgi:hypothetical protein